MKNYNQYYFFGLRYNNSEAKGYHRYFIEKNVDFDNFEFLERTKKELIDFKEKIMSISLDDESFAEKVQLVYSEYMNLYNYSLYLNKEINKDYKTFVISFERLMNKIKILPEKRNEYYWEILNYSKRLVSNNIRSLTEYIEMGRLFLEREKDDPLIFFDIYIANHDIRTIEFNIDKCYFLVPKYNTNFFLEISNFFRISYIPEFEAKLLDLQDRFIELFYSFKNKNTKDVLLEIDDLFLDKKKLQLEEQLFYSLSSNFLLTLIERFKDTIKNVKRKIIIIKKFVSINIINKAEKTLYKEKVEDYISDLFNYRMDSFLSIKVNTFEEFLRTYKMRSSTKVKNQTISYDLASLIYKDVIETFDSDFKRIVYSSEKGFINKETSCIHLENKYKIGKSNYDLNMTLETVNSSPINFKSTVISRDYNKYILSPKQYQEKIPFNVQINCIKHFCIY